MRQVKKIGDSIILKENITYKKGGDNSKLKAYLLKEQSGYCAYTETYLGRTDKVEIDHFKPISILTDGEDNYYNWFVVKAQWNSEKSNKWAKLQPVLHPTASDLEERIIYFKGDYIYAEGDEEAKNLWKLVKLDDPDLAKQRKRYIRRKAIELECDGGRAIDFFHGLHPEQISFIRAIEEEFGIDLYL